MARRPSSRPRFASRFATARMGTAETRKFGVVGGLNEKRFQHSPRSRRSASAMKVASSVKGAPAASAAFASLLASPPLFFCCCGFCSDLGFPPRFALAAPAAASPPAPAAAELSGAPAAGRTTGGAIANALALSHSARLSSQPQASSASATCTSQCPSRTGSHTRLRGAA